MKRPKMPTPVWILCLLCVIGVFPTRATGPSEPQSLRVGIREVAPFVIRGEGGWDGISIRLWQEIANRLDLTYRYEEFDLEGLIAAVAAGSIDVAVAPLTITAQREERFDFTHSYFSTGLGIAVSTTGEGSWTSILIRFFSSGFVRAIGALTVVLLIVGVVIWIVERRRNPDQFGGGPLKGIGSGFWWSAVTMTTVGYGDKAPRTLLGRLIGVVWMFAAIIMISGFTAAITSSLTVGRLSSLVDGPEDLNRVRAGALTGSTSASYLRQRRLHFFEFDSVEAGLEAIVHGNLDAMVHDAPVLRYLVGAQDYHSIEVLPVVFARQNYGFALVEGAESREAINRTLLEVISEERWQRTLSAYLGE